MHDQLAEFIRVRRIDSCLKLRLLLFMYQHVEIRGTLDELAQRLFLGDGPLLEEILNELYENDLVKRDGGRYRLNSDQPNIWTNLGHLASTFEDPLARQQILDQIRFRAFPGQHRTKRSTQSHLSVHLA